MESKKYNYDTESQLASDQFKLIGSCERFHFVWTMVKIILYVCLIGYFTNANSYVEVTAQTFTYYLLLVPLRVDLCVDYSFKR